MKQTVLAAILLLVFSLYSGTALCGQSGLVFFTDGVKAFDSKDYDGAVSLFKKAVELDPSNLQYQYYLGLTFTLLERYPAALHIFAGIVEKSPVQFMKVYFDISAIYFRQKKYQKALEAIEIAEEIDPGSARIYLEKGYIHQKINNCEEALNCFTRAKDLDPKLTQTADCASGAVLLEEEKYDQAEAFFRKAVEFDPKTSAAENAVQAVRNIEDIKWVRKPWYLTASLVWGYDDNVLLDPLDAITSRAGEVRGKADQFQNFLAGGGYKFINQRDFSLGAGYLLYCSGYKEWVENNILSHNPHFFLHYNEDPFYFRVQYDLHYYRTGGNKHYQDDGLYLTFGNNSEKKFLMHSILPAITILEPYNLKSDIIVNAQKKKYLDDQTPGAYHYSGRFVQSYRFPDSQMSPRIGYGYGYEDSADEAGSFESHELLAGLSSPVFWKVFADVALNHIQTNFRSFPVEGKRRDSTYIFSVSFNRALCDRVRIQLACNYVHNQSNMSNDGFDPYNYRRTIYFFSIVSDF